MAYNWLMMTSSTDDNWLSGSLGCSPTKLKKINKPKAEQETAQPTAAQFNNNNNNNNFILVSNVFSTIVLIGDTKKTNKYCKYNINY